MNPAADDLGDRSISPEVESWGGYLFPDMRILTRHGLIEVCEPGQNLPQFAAESNGKRVAQSEPAASAPGFIGPRSTDYVASIIAESRAGIPWKFFQTGHRRRYDAGLRFSVVVYDHVDTSYGCAAGHLFYSVSSDFACYADPLDGRSVHCIGLTVPDYIAFAEPEDRPDGDGGDDLDQHRIDRRVNELPSTRQVTHSILATEKYSNDHR